MLGLRESVPLIYLAFVRVYMGWFFLDAGWSKWSSGWVEKGTLAARIGSWMQEGKTYAFYANFLREQVLTHLQAFSWMVVAGELCVGASLLLGLGTRAGALVGLVMNVNFYLASAQPLNIVFALCNAIFLLVGGGRALGLDGLLRQRFPRWVIG
jgi:thiosulfate dehydrogenase [quinone] large subunit